MVENEYYYVSRKPRPYSDSIKPKLISWCEEYALTAYEYNDCDIDISLSFDKLNHKDEYKPRTNDYDTVESIGKEVFLSNYSRGLNFIYNINIQDGEYYLFGEHGLWTVEYYSKHNNRKRKRKIRIEFRDRIEYLDINLESINRVKLRPTARRKGTPIPAAQFKKILNLTVQFLYDPGRLTSFLSEYVANFNLLCEGSGQTEEYIIGVESTKVILDRLLSRKESLEKTLIEDDEISSSERVKLRGELQGILNAMSALGETGNKT